jgi:hypothetical protein
MGFFLKKDLSTRFIFSNVGAIPRMIALIVQERLCQFSLRLSCLYACLFVPMCFLVIFFLSLLPIVPVICFAWHEYCELYLFIFFCLLCVYFSRHSTMLSFFEFIRVCLHLW